MNRTTLVTIGAVALLGFGAYVVSGSGGRLTALMAGTGGASCGDETVPKSSTAATAVDPMMSTVCRFSCAAQDYDEAQVAVQPGVHEGELTRCPVSGVVFEVGDERPTIAAGEDQYRLCCDGCAEKFEAEPTRFVKL